MVVTVISHAWKENWRSHQEKAFKRRLSYQHAVVWTLSVVCKGFQFLSTWLETADDLRVGQRNDTGRNKCKTCNSIWHLKMSFLFLHNSDRDATCNNISVFKVSTIPWLQTFTWKCMAEWLTEQRDYVKTLRSVLGPLLTWSLRKTYSWPSVKWAEPQR